jgi:NAD(P)-dependent dehydrogenase (short-subunit alcohol dehydrogenase family)
LPRVAAVVYARRVPKLEDLYGVSGRAAVITGGGGALCGALAEGLASLGVRVAVLDVNAEKAEARVSRIREGGGDARAFACSVLDEAGLRSVLDEVVARWGRLDFLINGAGGNDPRASTTEDFLERAEQGGGFFDLGVEEFGEVFDLNFLGTFVPCKVFGAAMARSRAGSIVNISSMSALTPLTRVAAYSAAKAAVANFTRWLAVHLAHAGVRVNALAPGFFMTEQLRFLHIDPATGEYTPRAKKVIAHTPMGRYGEPEDLLGTVVWLLSDASKFVTGIVVPIDGGFSSYSI